jgi:NADPH-dependent ferric siderophore reductase
MNVLRKHLREGLGLPPSAASVIAYWRHKDHADDEGEKS